MGIYINIIWTFINGQYIVPDKITQNMEEILSYLQYIHIETIYV